MGLLIGGRLDDEEETGDVGYVCRYLLTDWGRRERVARCCERCRRSEGSHRRSGWRGSGGGSATGLGGREIVGVRCRVRVRWRQARWCGVYNRLGRHRGVESRRGGGSGSGRSGWRRWAGLPGSSRWAVVAAAVDRWWVSAGRLVGLAGRSPFASRGLSGCAGVVVRVCLVNSLFFSSPPLTALFFFPLSALFFSSPLLSLLFTSLRWRRGRAQDFLAMCAPAPLHGAGACL